MVWPLVYLIKKPPVPQIEGVILIEVKSCSALLCMLVICICGYLKLFPRYRFLVLGTYCLDTLYLLVQGCEDLWLFFCSQKGSVSKKVWEVLP